MNVSNDTLNKLIAFRKYLHKHPELSKKEHETAKKIKEFLSTNPPDKIIEGLGKTGLAAIYYGKKSGKTILIRGDIDALPIAETNSFEHASVNQNVSHKCGHDGHTTILAGLSVILNEKPIESGRVVLLFQPAEETGEGAAQVLSDPKFNALNPDYAFALHNLPGFDLNKVVIKEKHFAAASKGMIIRLTGKTSHAANPEHGISPALAVAEIIQKFHALSATKEIFKDFKLITLIHTRIGEVAFGTTPGYAVVMATLRSYRNDDMELLTQEAISIIEEISDKYALSEKIEFREEFPATVNNEFCVKTIREVCAENDLSIIETLEPFRWSEDFGHFTAKYPGAMFGIGAGKKHPALHNPEYDFPDQIINTGIIIFEGIIRKLLSSV